ncbi:hypothetical protein [Pontibacter litorisediminis]|uniref:hypothetical protein n=1 Tax=Pontibacter litorisediminis TaxID=1846260 RepID=UPI0023EDA25A|nr:hypothetical protein [Pontibacter litorisediminis]
MPSEITQLAQAKKYITHCFSNKTKEASMFPEAHEQLANNRSSLVMERQNLNFGSPDIEKL